MSRKLHQTKYFHISKLLAERFRYMPPGEPIPTMTELIAEFDSSQATISQALSRLRIQGIIERPPGRKRLVVAENAAYSLFKVTVIKPLWPSPDFDALLQAIYEEGLKEHWTFDVMVFTELGSLNWSRAVAQSDAFILISPANIPRHLAQAIVNSRKPVVLMRDNIAGVKANYICVDDRAVGQVATEHLINLGHKKVAVMLSEPVNSSSSMRMMGWRDAMKTAGISNRDKLIYDCSVRPGTDALSGSYERLLPLIKDGKMDFTAIFCVAWTGALAAMRALRESGCDVPSDVSLITYGSEGIFAAFLNPPLTLVRTDVRKHASEAIRLIKNGLEGADSNFETIILQPDIELRGTTAPLKRAKP